MITISEGQLAGYETTGDAQVAGYEATGGGQIAGLFDWLGRLNSRRSQPVRRSAPAGGRPADAILTYARSGPEGEILRFGVAVEALWKAMGRPQQHDVVWLYQQVPGLEAYARAVEHRDDATVHRLEPAALAAVRRLRPLLGTLIQYGIVD